MSPRQRFATSAVVVLVTLAAVPALGRGWKTPPELEFDHMPTLCERVDEAPASKFRLPHTGAENWPVYRAFWEEHELRIALHPETHRVRIISTKDAGFRTPEGIGLGSSLKEVREESGGEVQCAAGWTCFLTLPSGWSAGFSTVHSNPDTDKIEYRDPDDDSTVNSLVLRGECP
jgi:hypothetical protein